MLGVTLRASFSGTFLQTLPELVTPLRANSKHWFTTAFLQPLPYLVYAIGSRKLSVKEQFFVGAQTVVSLLQTTQIKQGVSFIAAKKVYTSINKNHNRLNREETLFFFLFFTRGGCASCLRACLCARLRPQSYQYPNSKHWFTTSFLQPLPYLVTP